MKQSDLRMCIAQFYENRTARCKAVTVHHFMAEYINRQTVYRILKMYDERGTVERKVGSCRRRSVRTCKVVNTINRLMN